MSEARKPAGASADRPVLFISDLHLSEERPETTRAFLAFLGGPARSASAVYILGDLFEYWAGDDDDTPFNRALCSAMAELGQRGVALYFLSGNRDLLAGEGFARAAGLSLLAEPTLIELGSHRVLLSHGDALCTDDTVYQQYRRQVRDPAWQNVFLARSLVERKAFIEGLRQHSEAAKREKATEIMDVNRDAVAALLREHGYPTLVHGHTHRPARHVHEVDGHRCERWVLADWHASAPYLAFDGTSFSTRELLP